MYTVFVHKNGVDIVDGHQKRRKTIETRIMNTAMELFKKHSFTRVSMGEISNTAKVSKMTLYKYFTNKHILIHKCLSEVFHTKADEIKLMANSNINFQNKVDLLMKSKIEFFQDFKGEMIQELLSFDPKLVENLLGIWRITMEEVSITLLEEGRKTGSVSSEITNESFIVFFDVIGTGIMNSPLFKEYSKKNHKAFDEIQKFAMLCLK